MFKIPEKIEYVIQELTLNGYEAYIVGGCVRDILLSKTPHDYDVTTSATPDETIKTFDHTIPTGIKSKLISILFI